MASRFGATSQRYVPAKTKLIVVSLLLFIVTSSGALWFLASNSTAALVPPSNKDTAEQPLGVTNTVRVLFAAQRIEEGTRLEDHMFQIQTVPAESIPAGAIKESERALLLNKYARAMIAANLPLVREFVADAPPLGNLPIPPGYRAVTIMVDAITGVEGFAKPNSRVDVLWTYANRAGQKEVSTLVPFVKVLSVGGQTALEGKAAARSEGQVTVSLLVTSRDAKRIELARTIGALTLTLVGEVDTAGNGQNPSATITVADLTGEGVSVVAQQEVPHQGKVLFTDPETGRSVSYVLRSRRWVKASEVE